jgi:uncharacterized protein (UPF0297 family)
MDELVESLVEVYIKSEDFLKIKETLTRIGVASKREKKIFQTCHILHKKGKYYIVHFKEMFALDGKPTNFSEEDKCRRNKIARMLRDWLLLEIVEEEKVDSEDTIYSQFKVISFKEKHLWSLETKYNMGKR